MLAAHAVVLSAAAAEAEMAEAEVEALLPGPYAAPAGDSSILARGEGAPPRRLVDHPKASCCGRN